MEYSVTYDVYGGDSAAEPSNGKVATYDNFSGASMNLLIPDRYTMNSCNHTGSMNANVDLAMAVGSMALLMGNGMGPSGTFGDAIFLLCPACVIASSEAVIIVKGFCDVTN